ncbi:hypothetical protein SAMN02745121_06168 [Nannocystis exedens]|uniref:Uncharacterized protein n=1 Tax=Nannocystis exedens TaxID=54 RepID=A0A1I2EPC6_9BACT|nr:hypothetical protein [Nannocystis exedens]PCC73912.1 hypothetical protein NAEX_07001 [Nannocystis exedens]SFE94346.1 hypothetical protein SAMN02745121_06168 [Nannocystis exedens]
MHKFALVPCLVLLACAVTYPTGWPAPSQPSQVLQATRGVMYGAAPRSWGLPDGAARHAQAAGTLLRPECRQGELEAHGRRLSLRHGDLRASKAPVGYVTWIDERGQALLAADIVRAQQLRLYDGSAEATPELRRSLALLTVALAWWEQASSPD